MADSNKGIHGLHWVRYGIAADQKYLLPPFAVTYDQLVVNANMVAHMPAAMSTFLSQTIGKPFVIDPQTHAFQHGVEYLLSTSKKSAGSLKRSWSGLVERYGSPISEIIGGDDPRALAPSDLDDAEVRKAFCERVMCFQRDIIRNEAETGKDSKYLKFLARKKGGDPFHNPPALLIAPYFFMGGPAQEDWREVNFRCLEASLAFKSTQPSSPPLAAEIVLSSESLSDDTFRESLIKGYSANRPDVFLVWVDSFREQAASKGALEGFIELVSGLAEMGAPVVNLFGGFFSVSQARVGTLQGKLMAICHGLEYGESKPIIPVSGGIPVANYYSNTLHFRLPPRVAYQEIQSLGGFGSKDKYRSIICHCDECEAHIRNNPRDDFIRTYGGTNSRSISRAGRRIPMQFPTAEASDHCTKHYMWCKHREYAGELDREQLKQRLREAHTNLKLHLGSDYVGHAPVWAELL